MGRGCDPDPAQEPRALPSPRQPHLSLFVTLHRDMSTAVEIHVQGDGCNGKGRSQPPGPAGWSLRAAAYALGLPSLSGMLPT